MLGAVEKNSHAFFDIRIKTNGYEIVFSGRVLALFARNANPGGDMKINNEQLDALLRQQEQASGTVRKQTGRSGSFEAALAEQLGLGTAGAMPTAAPLTPAAAQAGMISQMLLGNVEESAAASPEEDVLQEAFNHASGTLDLWDSYVNTLGTSGAADSLRDAYALLQGIDGRVAALKENTANVRGQNPGFDSLLNELEVLTATEKFKFNRGDYSV